MKKLKAIPLASFFVIQSPLIHASDDIIHLNCPQEEEILQQFEIESSFDECMQDYFEKLETDQKNKILERLKNTGWTYQ